ncbi:DNA gyrase/topoisomerase IV subunit A [Akkermansia glycaniphila]|nr:DNA gyrase/topoisomerase IV subunit A [Akkermansia glycaniphila]OCA04229.1 DNA topoisomerase [Akkermansia glycaniphila]
MSTEHPIFKTEDPSSIQLMYGDYYLEYASYVILERAVPHVNDGLKPVQRRILHSMDRMDDGRFNKVANIVGDTMKYHPHGDASIYSALVALGQKDLLVDTQGNWGNILTGDQAAAARYIEARLSKFAKEVVFSPKITEWKLSYDGRNKEPVTLPVKFPLLLAQGAFGIAVGLSCLILPHNFNELVTAAVACLRGEPFDLYPDFPTGGLLDVSDYRDGENGGRVRCRARIVEESKKLLRITEIPFGSTTDSVIQSIVAAVDKGKIKIAKIEDNTAANADILVHLAPGMDGEQVTKALYAFTECQVSLSPKACVILDQRPSFMGVSEILKHNVATTKEVLRLELECKLAELQRAWQDASLEKIFIVNRIYKVLEESESWEESLDTITERLQPFIQDLILPVTREDVIRLTEIKLKRIAKYEVFDSDRHIESLAKEIEQTKKNLNQLTKFTIRWFEAIGKKYGEAFPRRTELAEFDAVSRAAVAVENETLYVDEEGFAGYGVKKGEPVCKCSTLSDVITIDPNGVLMVRRIQEKFYVGKKLLYINVLRPDADPVFNMMYRDGREGNLYAKRFRLGGFTRDKEYQLTQGTKGSRVFFFSVHATEEESAALSVNVHIKYQLRNMKRPIPYHFSKLRVKGRAVLGNIVTKNGVERVARMMNAAEPEAKPVGEPTVSPVVPEESGEAIEAGEVAVPPAAAGSEAEDNLQQGALFD